MAAKALLVDLCESIVDCPHSTPVWTDSGVVVLRNQNIRGGRLNVSEPSYTDEAHFLERTRRALPKEGDLVITREAPMGEVCMIPSGLKCCLGQRMVLLRPDRERVDPRYLLYALQSKAVQHEIGVNEGTGSTVSNLRIPLLEALPIPIRPLPEQRAIAHILGTLDDKIELNRRMSETLEAMARALFKSWFVDFEPVRTKAESSNSGLPKPLADLFPSSFKDSNLWKIPNGWEVRAIEEVCHTVTRGVTPKYESGSKRYIINQRVNRGAHLDLMELKELSGSLEVPAERLAERWDVLVNCLGEGTLGRVHLFRGTSGQYAIDQHVSICRGLSSAVGAYLYQVLSSPEGQAKIESLKSGSTGMTMFNISKLRSFEFLWPGDALVQAYFRVAGPKLAQVAVNDEQSRTLSTLRDTLLPGLISGELSIRHLGDVSRMQVGV